MNEDDIINENDVFEGTLPTTKHKTLKIHLPSPFFAPETMQKPLIYIKGLYCTFANILPNMFTLNLSKPLLLKQFSEICDPRHA